MKKLIGMLVFLFSINLIFGADWQVTGFSRDGQLRIIYKGVPPVAVNVSQPKKMKIIKSQVTENDRSFSYYGVTGDLLKVTSEVSFNDPITSGGENEPNKEIVRSIYNRVKYSFPEPNFKLSHESDKTSYINGTAYFTTQGGVKTENTEVLFDDSINSGKLTTSKQMFINADFNFPKDVQVLKGTYNGSVILRAEFLGSNIGN